MLRVRGQWLRRAAAASVVALSGGPLWTAADSVPPGTVLQINNEARPQGPNLVLTGLYGATGAGNVLLTNDHDQGYNASVQSPIASPTGTSPLMAITGAFDTILPNGNVKNINLPKNSPFVANSSAVTSPLVDFTGAVAAAQAASQTVITVNGSVSLRADGTLQVQSASGSQVFGPLNWNDAANPLKSVLTWDGLKFNLNLANTLIQINGLTTGGDSQAAGLNLQANLTYTGVGAIVVQTPANSEGRGITVQGQDMTGSNVGLGQPASLLAARPGDGLALITNGTINLQEQGGFTPTVQAFLYAQGVRTSDAEAGIDLKGAAFQGMAVGGFINIQSLDNNSGTMTDQIVINGQPGYLAIPPQFPGGTPTYTATVSNWREATK